MAAQFFFSLHVFVLLHLVFKVLNFYTRFPEHPQGIFFIVIVLFTDDAFNAAVYNQHGAGHTGSHFTVDCCSVNGNTAFCGLADCILFCMNGTNTMLADCSVCAGGMGAVSPVPFANQQFMQRVEERIVRPTIDGLRADGIPYNGFIFIGLMNVDGNPFVVEYNVRMGDPETEVVMPRIKSDLLPLLERCAQGQLKGSTLETHKEIATTVIVVSDGYPGSYPKGIPITHCPNNTDQTIAFHAGTSVSNDQLVTAGGRVMACTALAPTLDKAMAMSYDIAQSIQYQGKFYRRDIGLDLK